MTDDADTVRGAAIYWIPELTNVGLENAARGLRRIGEWLHADGELPQASRSLAASLSTMLAFDYLIGNFDRWSGGNVLGDAAATLRLRARPRPGVSGADEREAASPTVARPAARRALLRRFYAALKRLTPRAASSRSSASDPASARGELLCERQFAGVFDRREALLSHIDSLIALHGERGVLVFE